MSAGHFLLLTLPALYARTIHEEPDMRRHLIATLAGLTLATAVVAPATAQQAPDWKQTLGGLLSGNQDRDEALRQAYERGYQRGRNDEARLQAQTPRDRDPRDRYDGGYDRRGYSR
jgi:hypothetical protein